MRIAKVSMGMSVCDSIVGFRAYDSYNNLLLEENWWDKRGHNPNVEICPDGSYEADLREW